MSEVNKEEIADLKANLDKMGVKYHHAHGMEKLTELLKDALEGKTEEVEQITESAQMTRAQIEAQEAEERKKEAMKLVRVVVHNNDPNKRDYTGDFFTAGNVELGFISKYVPFANAAGWHVPQILLNYLQEARVQLFKKVKLTNGVETSEGYLAPAFNVVILPDLTPKELEDLAKEQARAHSVD